MRAFRRQRSRAHVSKMSRCLFILMTSLIKDFKSYFDKKLKFLIKDEQEK
jgi:hypothetical protein